MIENNKMKAIEEHCRRLLNNYKEFTRSYENQWLIKKISGKNNG
jgi:hypothetical protein